MENDKGRTTHETGRREGAFEISCGRLAEQVDRDRLGIVNTLDTHERLNKEWLSEFEVSMHDNHHSDAKVSRPKLE